MKIALVGLAPFALGIGAICCQSPPDESHLASQRTPDSSAERKPRAVPKPIPGGDFFPDSGHHVAGIIHQFYPGPAFDGVWAEPNEIIDFNGTVAQVYMGGNATATFIGDDGKPHERDYRVDVDNRVYQGEFIATNGERAYGTFCEI
jgi:hypothetical protein